MVLSPGRSQSVRDLTGFTTPFRAQMAPIYLAKHVQNTFNGPSLFRERGIMGLVPGKLSELAIVGIPAEREFAYDGYYRNIDAFLYATATKEKVWCHLPGFTSDFQITPSIRFLLPPIAFVPSFAVSSDGEDKLVQKLGRGTSKGKVGKTVVYNITREVGKDELDKLIINSSDSYASGPDTVTPIGLRAGRFIQTIISAFLATHTYSAFPREVKGNQGTAEIRVIRFADLKRTDGPASVYTLGSKKARLGYVRDWASLPEVEEEPDAETEEGRKAWEASDKKYHGIEISNPSEAIYRAKPSPGEYRNNYGPSTAIPNSPGLVFPYFEGCNVPDPTFVKSIISTFFIRLLGDNSETVKKNFIDIRRGVNSVSTTKVGMEMAHMLAGIKLALDAQCRVFMVHDNEYRGFVLLGTGFSIFDGTSMHAPVSYERLLVDLAAMDPHQAGMQKVGECINLLADGGCLSNFSEESVVINEYRSVARLTELLGKIVIPKGNEDHEETLRELNKALRMLDFNEKDTWEINPQNLVRFLECYRDQDARVIESLPMKFLDWNTDYTDPLLRCLLAFGLEAPSAWNNTGVEFLLRYDMDSDEEETASGGKRKASEDSVYGNMPKELLVARKPVLMAYRDWKMVIEKKAVKMNMKERAKEYRLMSVKNEQDRKKIWSGFMGLVEVGRKLSEKAGPSQKKKAKVVEAASKNIDSFLADF